MEDNFTQRLSIIIKNNIHQGGVIAVKNTLVTWYLNNPFILGTEVVLTFVIVANHTTKARSQPY
jgi:hypothetical protein